MCTQYLSTSNSIGSSREDRLRCFYFFLTSVTKSITNTGSLVICLNPWFQFFWLTLRNGIVEFKIGLFSSSWWATLPSHSVAAPFYLPTWKARLISLTKGNHISYYNFKKWMRERRRDEGEKKKRKKQRKRRRKKEYSFHKDGFSGFILWKNIPSTKNSFFKCYSS